MLLPFSSHILLFVPPKCTLALSTSLFLSTASGFWLFSLYTLFLYSPDKLNSKILNKAISLPELKLQYESIALWMKFIPFTTTYNVWCDLVPAYLSPLISYPFLFTFLTSCCPSDGPDLKTVVLLVFLPRMLISHTWFLLIFLIWNQMSFLQRCFPWNILFKGVHS